MFGINAASEIFQSAIEEILTGLPGCKNISDDITVFGKTQREHDENLRGVLQRLQQHDVRLNKEKCSFSKSEIIKFYGHIIGKNGIKAHPGKIKAITDMSKPENVSEVRSLLGMAQYVSRYIPDSAATLATTVNQARDALAVGRRAATSIRQVKRHPDQESCDVVFQPETQDRSDSRREPRRTWRSVGARRLSYQLREPSTQRRRAQILPDREGNARNSLSC